MSGFCLALAIFAAPSSWPSEFRRIVVLAVIARIAGSALRLLVAQVWYGRGDALRYYDIGWEIASSIRGGDVGPFFASDLVWGTIFVQRVSAIVLVVVGESIRAESVVFSMFPLLGLILIVVSAVREFGPRIDGKRLAHLVLLWPSIWYWPSSIGKESLILLAVGLVVFGWCGTGRLRISVVVLGLALSMMIRPHIALMIAVAIGFAAWLGPFQQLTASRIFQGLLLVVLAVLTTREALSQLGLGSDAVAVGDFVAARSARTATGGSQIAMATGVVAIPMAAVNVSLRPFLWEVTNPLMLLSGIEVVVFWALVWHRRHSLRSFLRWRESRLLLLVVPLTLILTLFYGGFVANLGILARQRVVVLPFMFLLAEAAPALASMRGARAARRRDEVRSASKPR